jgi:hypothetical protein
MDRGAYQPGERPAPGSSTVVELRAYAERPAQ